MKKFLRLIAAIMAAALLSAPAALALEGDSPTEPDHSSTEVGDPGAPEDFVPAPQTGETGLGGADLLALAAAASTVCGAVTLVKAKKRAGSAR